VPKVPKVKGTKMTITCFGPVFIGLKWDFLYYELKGSAPIGMLEQWNTGIMGELVLLHLAQDKFTR